MKYVLSFFVSVLCSTLFDKKEKEREWVSKHARRHFCIHIPGIYISKEEMKKQGYTSNCMPMHRTQKNDRYNRCSFFTRLVPQLKQGLA